MIARVLGIDPGLNITDEVAPVAGAAGTTLVTQQPTQAFLLNPPRTITARFSFEF